MAGSMTDVNHEDGTGTISSKMLYHAGVLGLVALESLGTVPLES